MQIPDDALNECIELYKEEYGEETDRVNAQQMASDLLQLYNLLSRKLPSSQKAEGTTTERDDEDEPGQAIGFRA